MTDGSAHSLHAASPAASPSTDAKDRFAVQPETFTTGGARRSTRPAGPLRTGLRTLLAATVAIPAMLAPGGASAQPAQVAGAAAPQAAPGTAGPAAPTAPMPQTTAPSNPERVLLEQAAYWRGLSQPGRAIESLERLLASGTSADALALLAEAQIDDGKVAAARQTLQRLRAGYQGDPRIAEIERDLAVGQPDPAQLAEARALAQEGRPSQAVQAYQRVFKGPTPPNRFASEYYQTLGGTSAGFEPAREGLGQIVAADPRDVRAQLAYAKLLSYQEETRDEAIERLTALSRTTTVGQEADQALRQALRWLPDTAESLKPVEAYAQRHPDDAQMGEKLAQIRSPNLSPATRAGAARIAGYEKLDKRLLPEAEADFQTALSINAEDADATAGLGFLRLKQEKVEEGRALLKRALELGPTEVEGIEATLKSLEDFGTDGAKARGGAKGGGGKTTGGFDEAKAREVQADYARVAQLARRGRYEEAESLLRRLAGPDPDWGNYLQLGGIQAQAGKPAEAEVSYRRALARKPGDRAATVGLAGVLVRLHREREAEILFAQAGDTRAAGRLRGERLRIQARSTTDPVRQAALYRAAVQADPASPWLRLDLARALLRQGLDGEARAVMANVGVSGSEAGGAEAGFYFAVEINDLSRAAALAARVPTARRTAQMVAVQERVAVRAEIMQVRQEVNGAAFRARMLGLAAAPDPSGARAEEIARTLVAMNDRSAAADAVAAALSASPDPTVQQRLAYASALSGANREIEAETLLAPLDGAALPADQRQAFRTGRAYVTAAVADRLRQDGRNAEAAERLARRLAVDPTSLPLNLALARLDIARLDLGHAVAITRDLLEINPGDLDVRRGAVEALIAADDLDRAAAVAAEGIAVSPRDPRAYMISAQVARLRDENGRVMEDLRKARVLISARSGVGGGGVGGGGAGGAGVAPAEDDAATGSGRDAFRPGALGLGPSGDIPSGLGEAALALPDPLAQRTERDIATLEDEVRPQMRAGLGFLGRSGEGGLSRLSVLTAPLEASYSPGGIGRLRIQVTPTEIDGQTPRGTRVERFGTNPLRSALGLPLGSPGDQASAGVGLNVAYTYRFATFDVGTTPLGFVKSNVVGGFELAPFLNPELRVRLTGDRRAVINSALSYGGARDPATGLTWGGVVRNRGYGQIEWSPGAWFVYAGAGGGVATGERVRDNGFVEAAVGASYGLFRDGPREFRVGVNVPYVDYARNQNAFSFGSGGYFSPQNYVAVQLPVTWQDQPTDNLSYRLGASIGYQTFEQRSAAMFPNDPILQAALATALATSSAVTTGVRARGLSYAASAEFEYKISRDLRFGGRAAFQRAGDYTEGSAVLYGRYLFDTSR